jgi:HAD superfamily hydrolase (TIGR01484 family)
MNGAIRIYNTSMSNQEITSRALRAGGKTAAEKKIIVFDLDGTLTESKATMDREMARLMARLLEHKIVLVIGGGNMAQFKKQLLTKLNASPRQLKNLFIAPTSGASLYRYRGKRLWRIYQYVFTPREKKKIMAAFQSALRQCKYVQPAKIYGPLFEDRQSQITFSALGQKASPQKKKEWNAAFQPLRARITRAMAKRLPGFEVRMGGLTSIDVTRKGIDKVYGISRLLKEVGCSRKDMVYVGDALYKGGNDYVVAAAGIPTTRVNDWKETKDFIRALLASARVSGK